MLFVRKQGARFFILKYLILVFHSQVSNIARFFILKYQILHGFSFSSI